MAQPAALPRRRALPDVGLPHPRDPRARPRAAPPPHGPTTPPPPLHPPPTPPPPPPAAVACTAAGPADDAASRDLERAIRDAIAELPPAQRTVLLLRTDHGMSYEEISYVMGTGRDAVRMNLIEARRKLARKLRGIVDLGGDREVQA